MYLIGKRLFMLVTSIPLGQLDKIFALTLAASYAAIVLYIVFENMYPQNIAYVLLVGIIAHQWIAAKRSS